MFAWMTGSGSSLGGLPYTIDKEQPDYWKARENVATDFVDFVPADGTANATTTPTGAAITRDVTVFRLDKAACPAHLLQPMLNHYQSCVKIRHPGVLQVLDVADTNKDARDKGELIIVTRRCKPLSHYMSNLKSDGGLSLLSYGLASLLSGLAFIHDSAKLAHNNISLQSVYVVECEFKVFDFKLASNGGGGNGGGGNGGFGQFDDMCEKRYRAPERLTSYGSSAGNGPLHAPDAFSVGVLLTALYTEYRNVNPDATLPQALVKAVGKLTSNSASLRPTIAYMLNCPIFKTDVIKYMNAVTGLPTMPQHDKTAFYNELPNLFSTNKLPPSVASAKLIPALLASVQLCSSNIAAENNRTELLSSIQPLMILASTMDDVAFASTIGTGIPPLFLVNDRAVRGVLLQHIPVLSTRLNQNDINGKIFDPICSGFTDSSSALRELTLKSIMPLIPLLNASNLEKLARYLIRLQSDESPSIRTNTVIFIGKLAPKLSDSTRDKIILPAFARGLKDPFPFTRVSTLKALIACRTFFMPDGIAITILPGIMPLTLDPSGDVRSNAFGAIEVLMGVLTTKSQEMDVKEKELKAREAANAANAPVQQQHMSSSAAAANSSTGSGSNGVASWLTSAASAVAAPSTQATSLASAQPVVRQQQVPPQNVYKAPEVRMSAAPVVSNGGWDGDDGINDLLGGGGGGGKSKQGGGSGWSDDEFGDDDLTMSAPAIKKAPMNSMASMNTMSSASSTGGTGNMNSGMKSMGSGMNIMNSGMSNMDIIGGGGGGGGGGIKSMALQQNSGGSAMSMGGDDDFFNSFGGSSTNSMALKSTLNSANRPKLVVPSKMKGGLSVKKTEAKPVVKKLGGAAASGSDPFASLSDGWDNF
jgi:SCY1-like protein 1